MYVKKRKSNLGKFVICVISVCFSALVLALFFKFGLEDLKNGEDYDRTAYFEMLENKNNRY